MRAEPAGSRKDRTAVGCRGGRVRPRLRNTSAPRVPRVVPCVAQGTCPMQTVDLLDIARQPSAAPDLSK